MSELYRFKFRSDFFEIELESTDSDFIDKKMMQLIELSMRSVEDAPRLLNSGPETTSSTLNDVNKASAEADPVSEEAPKEEVQTEAAPAKKTARRTKRKGRKKKQPTASRSSSGSEIDPALVADQVKASDHYKVIRDKILKKSNQLNRILLSFYFVEQTYDRKKGITTGDVEAITESLGAGIKSTNISSQLKKYDQFFKARGERKRGSVVHYKLNTSGRQRIEALLQSA